MGFAIFSHFLNIWPFSALKFDDLRSSNQLVKNLSVPEDTKQFVFAVREPEFKSVIYILAAQNLSERSASDAEILIREVRPESVVIQIGHLNLLEIQSPDSDFDDPVPTSSFKVLKRCLVDKIGTHNYENVAGNSALRVIFGINLYGHFSTAKRAAEDVGSSLFLLESPFLNVFANNPNVSGEGDMRGMFESLRLQVSNMVPQNAGCFVSVGSKRSCLLNDIQLQMVKSLSPCIEFSALNLTSPSFAKPLCSYVAPPFARSVYPLLLDLYNIFVDLPCIGNALTRVQKILDDVSKGDSVNCELLREVYTFRIAIEGLRIALNNAARHPINRSTDSNETEFSSLSMDEKSRALLAQALRRQAKKFKTVVAIVDANGLAGLRKHWNTPVPSEFDDLLEQLVACWESDEEGSRSGWKKLLTKKSVVAVGAGATAALGVSSISKAVPVSTLIKMIPFKIPASFKLIGTVIGKALGTSRFVSPIASSGAKTAVSAEKIRVAVHSVIASAEKTSFSAMRTAFYEIMRSRRVRQVGFLPWAAFGTSIATCTGLLIYGDGIECAAESFPSARSIACLGRGIQSLNRASEMLKISHGTEMQRSMESLMYRFKKP